MSRYLIVAHQTAESAELLDRLKEILARESDAEFTIVVPATPVEHLLTWSEGESAAVARKQAGRARQRLEAEGARVLSADVGDASPVHAVRDALLRTPEGYDGIVICTFPAGMSRWLKLDAVSQVRRSVNVPVTHVEAQPTGRLH